MSDSSSSAGWQLAVYAFVLLVWALFAPMTCQVPKARAVRVLEDAGFSQPTVGGYPWFDCADTLAVKFSAVNTHGKRVHGVVCCGLAKDCTIRH